MKAVLVLSALVLSAASANACDYMRSAEAKVDQTVVASVTPAEQPAMSTAADALPPLKKEPASEEKAQ